MTPVWPPFSQPNVLKSAKGRTLASNSEPKGVKEKKEKEKAPVSVSHAEFCVSYLTERRWVNRVSTA